MDRPMRLPFNRALTNLNFVKFAKPVADEGNDPGFVTDLQGGARLRKLHGSAPFFLLKFAADFPLPQRKSCDGIFHIYTGA